MEFSNPKYGCRFKIKDKKRVILYLIPRDKFFKAAFVVDLKATDNILKSNISEIIKSNISEIIKTDIQKAKVYAEGRGIRIDVTDSSFTEDLKKMISIKISS